MLEYTSFRGWYYGVALDKLSDDKINIAVLNPTGVRAVLTNKEIDATIYYVRSSDKERLLR